MGNLQLTHIPVMKTGMVIRRPAAEVFEAFVNPDITTQFWFTRSSGRLEPGTQVEWSWEMYNVSAAVTVKADVITADSSLQDIALDILVQTTSDPSILGMASHLLYLGQRVAAPHA